MTNDKELKESILTIPSLLKKVEAFFTKEDKAPEDKASEVEAEKAPEVKESKFIDAKLADGTIVRYEEIGQAVMVIDEAGAEIAAPDGKLPLEDGSILVVQDGVLQEIVEAAIEEEEAELEKAPSAAPSSTSDAIKKTIESIVKETVFALEEKFEALTAENKELKEELAKVNEFNVAHFELTKKNIELTEKIGAQPGAESAVTKKDGFKVANGASKSLAEFRKNNI